MFRIQAQGGIKEVYRTGKVVSKIKSLSQNKTGKQKGEEECRPSEFKREEGVQSYIPETSNVKGEGGKKKKAKQSF